MSSLAIALIVCLCVFGAGVVGLIVHKKLPDHHLDGTTQDVVKLVMGLIATLAALALGLLIASANSTYQTERSELQIVAADIVQADRILAHYGPETKEVRDLLHQAVMATVELIWPSGGSASLDPEKAKYQTGRFFDAVQKLAPTTDAQRFDQSRVLQLTMTMAQTRMLMFEQSGNAIPWPFLMVLVFWLAVLFLGFGLFARPNATVIVALLIGAISVSGAIFLMLELSEPYGGLIRISDAPIRNSLAQIDR